ncbi:MAG: hypothetical protein R3B82_12355 [Sandaracinaceae bacterium]
MIRVEPSMISSPAFEDPLADALAVDVGAVQRPEITEDVAPPVDQIDVAVLLRHDPIQHLNGVVRVPPERVVGQELDLLTAIGAHDGEAGHDGVVGEHGDYR